MAKLSRDLGVGTLHPRETLSVSGTLAAANAELVLACDGCAAIALDLRGTFNLSVELAGTVDGVNWTMIPVRLLTHPTSFVAYLSSTPSVQPGVYIGACIGFRQVRARCNGYSSGAAAAALTASVAPLDQSLSGMVTPSLATATGASGAAVTLSLASPGPGLRHYLTQIEVTRSAAAALTAGASPAVVTTTNLPGSLAFTIGADAAAQGTDRTILRDYGFPLVASVQNAATTIVCPATTGVIWRATAGFYVAP